MPNKTAAFSLIELLVAIAISAVVITAAMGTVGQIYFTQKKILASQDFYNESRFLMERIVQIARNNTIDFDRYFEEIGPVPDQCPQFDTRQVPDNASNQTDQDNKKDLTYPSFFYWDTNGDGTPDRNLGGANPDGTIDPCTKTFYPWVTRDRTSKEKTYDEVQGRINTLYLINGDRTVRTAIRETFNPPKETDLNKIEIQRQIGADTDNDGLPDLWGPRPIPPIYNITPYWDAQNEVCMMKSDTAEGTKEYPVYGNKNSQTFCQRAHDWTVISPDAIEIQHLTFKPSPDRDPFLSFRNNATQTHPHVFISLKTKLKYPDRFGFEERNLPFLSLQTAASSRVFGDGRK